MSPDKDIATAAPKSVAAFLPTDTRYKAATFIETYTGRAFWPLNPSIDALSIIDIAHALSNQCRYTGHVRYFYSVAQHCCLLSKWVADHGGDALTCLQVHMHDAPEAYLVDIARPVKQYMPEYRVWDHKINDVIREWMGWKDLPIPGIVDDLDSRIIVDERAQLMSPEQKNDWGHRLKPVGVKIEPWSPVQAEQTFLMQYAAYSKEVYGTHQYINHAWGIPIKVFFETISDVREPTDIMEIDIRGHVARVRVRDSDGILVRDPAGGAHPRVQGEWMHGRFEVQERRS
jgi:hypothetical protein